MPNGEIVEMTSMSPEDKELCEASLKAMDNAYCPYSKFSVGAAIRCENGEIFTGCNVENASYGLAICAERTAVVKAVSSGRMNFIGIAIAAHIDSIFTTPCGACRQFMAEFNPELPIFLVREDKMVKKTSLACLLPEAFTPKKLSLPFKN